MTTCPTCSRPTDRPTGYCRGHARLYVERERERVVWEREAMMTQRDPLYGTTVLPLVGGDWRLCRGGVWRYVRRVPAMHVSDRVPSDGTGLPDRQDTPA